MKGIDWPEGIFIIVAIVVVMIARWRRRRSVISGRKPLSLAEMYRRDSAGTGVSCELFEKVLNMIGKAYHIDPRMLRPSDKLKVLYDIDSWDLGEGTEKLNEQVLKNFGITHFEADPQTIKELVSEIGRQTS